MSGRRISWPPISLTVPVALVVMALLIAAAQAWRLVRRSESEVRSGRIESVGAQLSRAQEQIEVDLRGGRPEGVQRVVSALAYDRSLLRAMVVSGSGRVIASTRLSEVGLPTPFDQLPTPLSLGDRVALGWAGEVRITPDGSTVLGSFRVHGVGAGEQQAPEVAVLLAWYDLRPRLEAARFEALSDALGFAAAMISAAVVLALLLYFALAQRASKLMALARRLAVGELSARSGLSGSDELGALASAIDGAAAELESGRKRLAESEARVRLLLDSTDEGILGFDPSGVCVFANPSVLTMAKSGLVGRAVRDFLCRSDLPAGSLDLGALLRGEPLHFEGLLTRSGAPALPVECRGRPLRQEGRLVGGVLTLVDLTERRAMQAKLMAADRMASLGALAVGVGHEINNPLAYVLSSAELIRRKALAGPSTDVELTLALRDLIGGLERIRDIVRDLTRFARPDVNDSKVLDLPNLLDSMLHLANNDIRHRAKVVRTYRPTPKVVANESRLGQVFLNLLVNAAQAIPEGHADQEVIEVSTGADDAGQAVVEIRDSGAGIPDDVLPSIFSPFFTTKPVGEGTGLGLAIAQSIVGNLKGSITVRSRVGQGTTFRVVLPAGRAEAAVPDPSPTPAPGNGPRGRVLIIDDEPQVARTTASLLSSAHDVQVLDSARKALERVRAGERWDAVVCDLMMPEMSGIDFYEQVNALDPAFGRRILFVSGGAFTPRASTFQTQMAGRCLEKPFRVNELLTRLRHIMG